MAKITVTFEGTKDRLHRAYRAAKAADRQSSALFDRSTAEVLTLSKGQPVERAVAMLLRTAVMLEIAADRKGWPDRIAGLPDRQRSPRASADGVFSQVAAVRAGVPCAAVRKNHRRINAAVGTESR